MPSVTGEPPFTYLTYDLATGAALSQFPFQAMKFSSILNTPGPVSFELDLTDPEISKMDPITATAPNRTMLCIDYDGALIWGGQITTRRWQRTTRKFQFGGQELWSWFHQRVQASDYSFVPTYPTGASMALWNQASFDASMIAAQVITDALAPPVTATGTTDGSTAVITSITTTGIMYGMPVQGTGIPAGAVVIGITSSTITISQPTTAAATSSLKFGVIQNNIVGGLKLLINGAAPSTWASVPPAPSADWVAPTYPISSSSSVDSIVTQLSQLGLTVGFDFGVNVAYSGVSGSPPVATIDVDYPRRGRDQTDNQLTVDLSSAAVFDYEFPEDGTSSGIVNYMVGGSAGGVANAYVNLNPINQGYPLTEEVTSQATVTTSLVLQKLAMAASAMASYPVVVATITMEAFGANPQFGDFIVGDDILVMMPSKDQDQAVFDPRFPNGMYEIWRICQYDIEIPDDGGTVTMKLTLNQPLALTAAASPI